MSVKLRLILRMLNPDDTTWIIATAITVPSTWPLPPLIDVPPSTVAATACMV